jgi:2-methylcitrate dehydratase
VWLDDFTEARIADPAVRALMQKISVRAAADLTAAWPAAYPFRITVTTTDGERLVREVHYAKGHPNNPLSDAEVGAKFMKLATPVLGEERSAAALSRLWQLEKFRSVRGVLDLFRVP